MCEKAFMACEHCQAEGQVELPSLGGFGPLLCPNCGRLATMISVEPWQTHIEKRVSEMARRQRCGAIGTRKQSYCQSAAYMYDLPQSATKRA